MHKNVIDKKIIEKVEKLLYLNREIYQNDFLKFVDFLGRKCKDIVNNNNHISLNEMKELIKASQKDSDKLKNLKTANLDSIFELGTLFFKDITDKKKRTNGLGMSGIANKQSSIFDLIKSSVQNVAQEKDRQDNFLKNLSDLERYIKRVQAEFNSKFNSLQSSKLDCSSKEFTEILQALKSLRDSFEKDFKEQLEDILS